jgi:mRNA-degrading endonuclease RelE of RelBE toxin-antitoxin system
VSLHELLREGPILAEKKPLMVFSHMISHMSPEVGMGGKMPELHNDYLSGSVAAAYTFLPDMAQSEFSRLAKEDSRQTSEIQLPAKQMRQSYERALTGVRRLLTSPEHEDFPSLVTLFTTVDERGTALQMITLIDEILDRENPDSVHTLYRKIRSHINSGTYADFFSFLKEEIHTFYDDSHYRTPDSLDLPNHTDKTSIATIEQDISKLKATLLPYLSEHDSLSVSVPIAGDKDLQTKELFIQRTNTAKGTVIQDGTEVPGPTGEPITLALALSNGTAIDWNLISMPDDLPETYHAFAALCREALQTARMNVASVRGETPHSKGIKKKNGVHKMQGSKEHVPHVRAHAAEITRNNGNNHRPEIVLDERMLEDLAHRSPHLGRQVAKGIEKYRDGKGYLTQLMKPSPEGNIVYRYRIGDTRIIFEKCADTGILHVIDAGDREGIYRKYNYQMRD